MTAIEDIVAAITRRMSDINASMELPVSLAIEYSHGVPKYFTTHGGKRREFESAESLLAWIVDLQVPAETLYLEYGHGGMRFIVSTPFDNNIAHEFEDPEVLLAWLDNAGTSPDALSEALRYRQKEALLKRRAQDARELEEINQAIESAGQS